MIVASLVAVLLAAAGLSTHQPTAQAQMAAQTFVIMAGASGPANMEILAFAPAELKVHRGDTVTWFINGFHNVRLGTAPIEMIIAPVVDGQPLPQINPEVAFPTIASGSAYTGGVVGSGLPVDPNAEPVFSLIMDVEPGTYAYFCDIHPGMVGAITVVADDVAIPSPMEALATANAELGQSVGMGMGAMEELSSAPPMMESGVVQVRAGGDGGRATIQQYFPFATVIHAGESVTWYIPVDAIAEPHTVSWPPTYGQEVSPIPQDQGPPILAVGPSLTPMTDSGVAIGSGDSFSSGLFFPGDTFTLTFTEPGIYPYTCNIHLGMNGVVVVLPAE